LPALPIVIRLASVRVSAVLAITGSAYLAAVLLLLISRTPLGSPLFFIAAGLGAAAYIVLLLRVWSRPTADRRVMLAAFALALAIRMPLSLAPVGADSDMIRYLWDGRVQRLGYNPYLVRPSDPVVSQAHTAETVQMPSLRTPTPYPPAAQLFFRLVAMVLWRWLIVTGSNEWLALAYAWNPLVVLEVAHSGHIDALGALWITASVYWLARQRTLLATVAFVMACATKLLPIVLAPLYWRRISIRDAIAGGALVLALYLPFTRNGELPFGAVPNVVAHIRFNGPVFQAVAAVTSPQMAAAFAVLVGLLAAIAARLKLEQSDPAGWAWPMAIALACAPVVYPWYLLYVTPFLFVRRTLPLMVWTFTALGTYIVWHLSRRGGRWIVPVPVMFVEYSVPILALIAVRGWYVARSRSHPAGG
jgi:hypothetical protein